MTDDGRIDTPWTKSDDLSDAEARAAELIEQLGPPETLDAAAYARIASNATQPAPSRPRPLAFATVAAALVGCVGGASAATWVAGAPGPAAWGELEIVGLSSGVRLSRAATGEVQVIDGHVAVRTASAAAKVRAGEGLVAVQPGSAVELLVRSKELVRVATVAGSAKIIRATEPTQIPAGRAWTPEGLVEQPASRARWIMGRLDPAPEPKLAATAKPAATALAETPAVAPPPKRKAPAKSKPRKIRGGSYAVIELADEREMSNDVKQLLDEAMRALHGDEDPKAARAILEELAEQWPEHASSPPVIATKVAALLAERREWAALDALDGAALDTSALAHRLRAQRAELRARAGRCYDALEDTAVVLKDETSGPAHAQALYWRGACRVHVGKRALGREDVKRYLELYPDGALVKRAKKTLAR